MLILSEKKRSMCTYHLYLSFRLNTHANDNPVVPPRLNRSNSNSSNLQFSRQLSTCSSLATFPPGHLTSPPVHYPTLPHSSSQMQYNHAFSNQIGPYAGFNPGAFLPTNNPSPIGWNFSENAVNSHNTISYKLHNQQNEHNYTVSHPNYNFGINNYYNGQSLNNHINKEIVEQRTTSTVRD